MAYSNTNRDNLQHNWIKTIKRAGFAIILVIILVSSLVSIYQQGTILRDAQSRNRMMEQKVVRLQEENRLYKKRVEYATGSAAIARKTPGDDYRLILPPEEKQTWTKEGASEVLEKPIIIQWWELFTK